MSKKKDFELLGSVVGEDGQLQQRGQVLSLEVGDDGLPTSELYRVRSRALGDRADQSADGNDEDGKQIVKDAKAKAKQIVADAEAKAKEITDKAEVDAQALLDAAKS